VFPGIGFGFDFTYLLFMIPGFALAMWARYKVKSTYAKYAQVPTTTHVTGQEAAQRIIRSTSLQVGVQGIDGELTDRYDPRSKTVALSQSSMTNSVAAVAIVAHELGHALQDKANDPLLKLRGAIVPIVNIGSGLAPWLFMGGVLLGLGSTVGSGLAWLGIIGFGLAALFSLITLPVEFDASRRAVAVLQGEGLVMPREAEGVRSVLNAAALTYVAAAAMAVLQLVRLVMLRNMRDE
jgi:Zn-dependent membrane protease YugP